MTRADWARFEEIQEDPNVVLAMKCRCEEQGHEREHGMTSMYQIVLVCKWCGEGA